MNRVIHRYSGRRNGMTAVFCLLSFALILLFCSQVPSQVYPPGAWTIDNQGQVCFKEIDNSTAVQGYFRPKGCFSSSCTRTLEQSLTTRVDPVRFRIELDARFVLVPYGNGLCTHDCNGAGTVQFDIGDVDSGVYSIWLGSDSLGVINIPPKSITGQDLCLGEW
jgi:hypothetical protein